MLDGGSVVAGSLCDKAEVVFGEARHSRVLAGDEGKRFARFRVLLELVLADSDVVVHGGSADARIPRRFEIAERRTVITALERRVAIGPVVGLRVHRDRQHSERYEQPACDCRCNAVCLRNADPMQRCPLCTCTMGMSLS